MTVGTDTTRGDAAPMSTADPLQNAMGPGELRRALNLSSTQFYLHQREGRFKRFELPRPIGRKRYSGRLVERYLAGGGK